MADSLSTTVSNTTTGYKIHTEEEYDAVFQDFIHGNSTEGYPTRFEQGRALIDWRQRESSQGSHGSAASRLPVTGSGTTRSSVSPTELDTVCEHNRLALLTNMSPETPQRDAEISVLTPTSQISHFLDPERLPGQIPMSTYLPGASQTQANSAAPSAVQNHAMQNLLSLLNFAPAETTASETVTQDASSGTAVARPEEPEENKLNEHAMKLLRLLNILGTDTTTSDRKMTAAADTVLTGHSLGNSSATKVRLGDGLATIRSKDVAESIESKDVAEQSVESGDESSDHEQGGVAVHEEAEEEVGQLLKVLGLS